MDFLLCGGGRGVRWVWMRKVGFFPCNKLMMKNLCEVKTREVGLLVRIYKRDGGEEGEDGITKSSHSNGWFVMVMVLVGSGTTGLTMTK